MESQLMTFGILFFFALVGGILASRFKQPILLGLLLVGALIGPFAFGLVNDAEMTSLMIDLGAILLLFVIGLEFDVTKLKKIGLKAIIVGLLKDAIVLFDIAGSEAVYPNTKPTPGGQRYREEGGSRR